MADEIEIKLSLPESARRRLLRHPLLAMAQKLGTRRLVNIYHDTPDLALQRHAIALRLRRQGRAWLQTVKCAGISSGGLAIRPEWEQAYSGSFDFSAVTDRRVRVRLERKRMVSRLAPVFQTVFSRTIWRLSSGSATFLLMLDRGWIEAGGRREAISELEIEMAQGDTAAVFEVALALVRDLPLRPAILSKAERGYRLACGSVPRPVKAAASSLSAEQTPLAAFRSVVAACIVQLQMNELGANSDDPEFVHQMRVALRRLRAALRAFQPALPPEFVETLLPPPLAHVRALARVLGEARDWDVLATEVVAPAQAAFAGDGRLAALRDAVEAQRRQAREAARLALAAREHAGFLLGFSAMLERLAAVPDSISLIGFSKRRLSKLHKKLLALAAAAQQGQADSASLHALRIAAKRFRYAMEFFAPLHDRKEVGAALELLTELQDTIGSLNDLANAGARLMRCAGEEPALREALALLGGWHGPRHAALRARLPRLMRALTESPRYWR